MPANLDDLLCRAMINPVAAVEIARQMNAGVGNGNADLLCRVGISATSAIELAAEINAGVFSAANLCAAMWDPVVAVSIKIASGL
jgi:hypothetical protein